MKDTTIEEEIEDKVIDYINSEVTGRLIIIKPEKSIYGADLAIERRGKYKEKELYFRINSLVIPAKEADFIKDFPQESFKADKSFYLIFVYFDDIKQKIDDHIWLVPSLQFRDIADVVKSQEGKKMLRFQVPSDVKVKNKYSKYIIEIKELGKIILDALEKGGKLEFKAKDFSEASNINLETLREFLSEARKNTYASNATAVETPRLLASKQLDFQKAGYAYRDIYFSGNKKFMGQEIVYLDSKPIWGMNYVGSMIRRLEEDFLKESLFRLAEKCRFGGICEYEKRELKYQDQGQGSLEEFSGKEEIFSEGKSVYKLNYLGGIISDKI